jgi:hypothetical protein
VSAEDVGRGWPPGPVDPTGRHPADAVDAGPPVAGGSVDGGSADGRVDFFVSYTGADADWAEWVAWVLEDAGYTTRIQAWDFAAGCSFVSEMHQGARDASRTIAVLSNAYLSSEYAEAEWQAAWAGDPSGRGRKLLAVRTENCARPGLLSQLVTVDLFDVDRAVAADRLLAAAHGERGKPAFEPAFPGSGLSAAAWATSPEPTFPGQMRQPPPAGGGGHRGRRRRGGPGAGLAARLAGKRLAGKRPSRAVLLAGGVVLLLITVVGLVGGGIDVGDESRASVGLDDGADGGAGSGTTGGVSGRPVADVAESGAAAGGPAPLSGAPGATPGAGASGAGGASPNSAAPGAAGASPTAAPAQAPAQQGPSPQQGPPPPAAQPPPSPTPTATCSNGLPPLPLPSPLGDNGLTRRC